MLVDDVDSTFSAAAAGDSAKLMQLLGNGSSVNARDSDGRTVLHHAAVHGQESLVASLLESEVKVDAADEGGWTPLLCASSAGHDIICAALLSAGAAINARAESGCSPLICEECRCVERLEPMAQADLTLPPRVRPREQMLRAKGTAQSSSSCSRQTPT